MGPLWLAMLACAPSEPGCRPGFARAEDGHCYPPPPALRDPSVTDALENLPDCVPHKPTGEVDLTTGCADGACAGDTFEAIDLALGGDADCDEADWSDTWQYCRWGETIEGLFEEDDDDEVDPASRTSTLRILSGYTGATDDGLGTDVAPRCFVEELGTPERVVWLDVAGDLEIFEMAWERYGLVTYDLDLDGTIDDLYLSGEPE